MKLRRALLCLLPALLLSSLATAHSGHGMDNNMFHETWHIVSVLLIAVVSGLLVPRLFRKKK